MAKNNERSDPRIERTRKRVLEAAHQLLHRGGPTAITYSALAERSGVGRATIYRHWPVLDALWSEVVAQGGKKMKLELTGDLRTDLNHALQAMAARLASAERRASMITMMQRAQWDKPTQRFVDMAQQRSPVRQALSRAVSDGTLPASLDINVATALLTGPLLHQVFLAGGTIDQAFIDTVVDGFVSSHPVTEPGQAIPDRRSASEAADRPD